MTSSTSNRTARTADPIVRPVQRRWYRADRRLRGFTLFELLLVLTLVVAIAALTLPALRGPLDDQRLLKSAELVRTQWNRARNTAMKTGRMQMFRFEPGGRQFLIQPWYEAEDYLETNLQTAQRDQLQAVTGSAVATAAKSRELPEGTQFLAEDVQLDQRAAAIEETILASGLSEVRWSRPILFYPDGTSSTAEVVLANERGQLVAIVLRGLTGASRVREL